MEDLGFAAGLEVVVGCSHHLVDADYKERDNPHDLDCHRVRLEEHHHRAEVVDIAAAAARIRTAAVVGLVDCREAAVEEEGSCTVGCQPSGEQHRAAGSVGCKGGDSSSEGRPADERSSL